MKKFQVVFSTKVDIRTDVVVEARDYLEAKAVAKDYLAEAAGDVEWHIDESDIPSPSSGRMHIDSVEEV